jgi:cell division protein FtsI (penicillin-binding protein 3)
MERPEESHATRRLQTLARVAYVWAGLIFLRLLELQIISHDDYRKQAEQQQVRQIELRAPRGQIQDRSGQPLAISLPVDSVCLNPMRVPDAMLASELLGGILSMDRDALRERIESARNRGFLWVKRKITPQESARLKSLGLDWIEFRRETRRFYPKIELAAHVLGSVDHEDKGNAGLELSLDKELQGRPGLMRVYQDVRARGFDSQVFSEPQPGRTVTLTLDERIQHVAERELAAAVEANHCKTGSLVVMQPETGEILAMANYPTYDPNEPPASSEELSSRLNLSVSAPFEPGSVFKVITLSAALERTSLHPDTFLHCGNGRINLFGRVIRDHHPHGVLSVADILAKSSNIGAIQIGLRVGEESMYEYVRRFGFGRTTGLPLPAESPGMLRVLKNWGKTSIGSIAMGHELSTTTVQLARACSVIANGGLLVRPRIVTRLDRPGEQPEVLTTDPPKRILDPETAITMRQMMEGVVLRGTGTKARLDGYTSGGKTGSAQIYDYEARHYTHRYNASFMGFAPVTRPAIVVVVTLNGASKFGGAVAAPVFREVATAALRILDVPKDLPDGQPRPEPETSVDDLAIAELSPPSPAPPEAVLSADGVTENPADIVGPKVPDFRGLTKRAVMQRSAALGLPVVISGSGLARAQQPPAGTVLGRGERIRVEFAR